MQEMLLTHYSKVVSALAQKISPVEVLGTNSSDTRKNPYNGV